MRKKLTFPKPSNTETSFAELFEEALKEIKMKPGAIVTATVVDIDSDWVTVHAGLRSEGVIPKAQFLNDKGELTIAIGDKVQVALDAVEDGFGETRLSREKAKRMEAWKDLETAFEADQIISGVISGKVRGGYTVDVNTIRAFLPESQLDKNQRPDNKHLEGREVELKILKLDQKRNNLVVSWRAAIEGQPAEYYKQQKHSVKYSKGETVTGTVVSGSKQGIILKLEGGFTGFMASFELEKDALDFRIGETVTAQIQAFGMGDQEIILKKVPKAVTPKDMAAIFAAYSKQ